jgi:hypothetical protein
MGGALLMSHQDVLHILLGIDCIVDVEYSATGIAEDVFHTFVFEEAHQDLGTAQFHCQGLLR